MKAATKQGLSYPSKAMNIKQKKAVAFQALQRTQPITHIAAANQVSRQFVYKQKHKATQAIEDVFKESETNKEKVLFYLPVTVSWLWQFILCLVLNCRANYRGIQKILLDAFDYDVSFGTIHNVVNEATLKAKKINDQQDLSPIKLAAQDEMFHYNQPLLTGIDIRSLYCYLMVQAPDRGSDTWGIHLLDLKEQGFHPERVFGDDADGLRAAHQYVYPTVPYDLDHFHVIRDLMDLRRYFRNSLKSAVTLRDTLQAKVNNRVLTKKNESYQDPLEEAKKKEKEMRFLSQTIDTLVNWMQHDVLCLQGVDPDSRYQLFDFILDEFKQLAKQHPHRIAAICTTLENQQHQLLAFTDVLDQKFQAIADEFIFPLEKIWAMCELQRCQYGSDRYAIRSLSLQDYFGSEFDEVEDAVLNALNSTERTSAMVENLHGRLRPYFYLRREIGYDYLELLRFYLNHVPFQRSRREERRGKTPAEVLTGQTHDHWLDLLGFQRFKQAA